MNPEQPENIENISMSWGSDAIAEMLQRLDLHYIALNPGASFRGLHDSIVKSYKKGAAYFIPKEEMARITEFLSGILKAKEKGKSTWLNWLEMLTDAYWEKRFGPNWKNEHKAFWENFPDHD